MEAVIDAALLLEQLQRGGNLPSPKEAIEEINKHANRRLRTHWKLPCVQLTEDQFAEACPHLPAIRSVTLRRKEDIFPGEGHPQRHQRIQELIEQQAQELAAELNANQPPGSVLLYYGPHVFLKREAYMVEMFTWLEWIAVGPAGKSN